VPRAENIAHFRFDLTLSPARRYTLVSLGSRHIKFWTLEPDDSVVVEAGADSKEVSRASEVSATGGYGSDAPTTQHQRRGAGANERQR
jgi:hypothetical protein